MKLKEQQDPVAERMRSNGEKITRDDLEPKPVALSAALTGTAAVTADLTVVSAVPYIRLVHPAQAPAPEPEDDDRDDDDDECRRAGLRALVGLRYEE